MVISITYRLPTLSCTLICFNNALRSRRPRWWRWAILTKVTHTLCLSYCTYICFNVTTIINYCARGSWTSRMARQRTEGQKFVVPALRILLDCLPPLSRTLMFLNNTLYPGLTNDVWSATSRRSVPAPPVVYVCLEYDQHVLVEPTNGLFTSVFRQSAHTCVRAIRLQRGSRYGFRDGTVTVERQISIS